VTRYLGIDPGQSGGIVVLADDGTVHLISKMPATEGDLAQLFEHQISPLGISYCLIEKVHSFPDQGVASSFTFGRGTGILIGLLMAHKIRFEEITPQAWQKLLAIPPRVKKPKKPKLPFYPPDESQAEWKNRLKAKAQQMFPSVGVTLATADALLIAETCRRMNRFAVNLAVNQ
jgi:hypothetical protein